jgi:hypothetical protein
VEQLALDRGEFLRKAARRAEDCLKRQRNPVPFWEEMCAEGEEEERAQRHAMQFCCVLTEIMRSAREGLFWELPRELPLVDTKREPLLKDLAVAANTAAHFIALARQVIFMRLGSRTWQEPTFPVTLRALSFAVPLDSQPALLTAETLGTPDWNLAPPQKSMVEWWLKLAPTASYIAGTVKRVEAGIQRLEIDYESPATENSEDDASLEEILLSPQESPASSNSVPVEVTPEGASAPPAAPAADKGAETGAEATVDAETIQRIKDDLRISGSEEEEELDYEED